MKHLLYAIMLIGLFACQKENRGEEQQPPAPEPAPVPAVCKVNTIREYPAVDGNSILRTFTYDDKNRVTKLHLQYDNNVAVTKNISYNAEGKIDNISYSSGASETFAYTNGVLTGWEAFEAAGNPAKKTTFTYNGGKLVREDRFVYNTTAGTYQANEYVVFEWNGNGNITAIKTFGANDVLKASDTYAYDAQKLNKQQTITPQMDLMFMNWSNDITAFINSKHLLNNVISKKRKLVYETNDSGFITAIKSDRNDNFFTFAYACSN